MTSNKKYKAHSWKKLNVGDEVIIEQAKPVSKGKKWNVVEKIDTKK
jgi:ribosomal protein S17